MARRHRHPVYDLLRRRGITQGQLAAGVNCNPEYVCAVLSGARLGSPELRQAIAEYLGEPVTELFHDEVESWEARVAAVIDSAPPAARQKADRLAAVLGGVAAAAV
jgi:transcriptional regulator with XRE-family HTH domain